MTTGHAAFAVLGVALIGGWLVALAALRKQTPQPAVQAQPPTSDLRPESPAVAGMLVQGGYVGPGAAAAILLDLAARHVIGLEQVGQQLTLRLRPRSDADLASYERLVLSRVQALAADGVLPAQALTAGEDWPPGWQHEFDSEVTAEARDRGLTTQRWSSAAGACLIVLAVAAGASVGLAVAGPGIANGITGVITGAVGGLLAGGLLLSIARGGDRLTVSGAAAAGHWLGVRAYLAADSSLAGQPPTAVVRYGRYLGYAAALGVAGTAVSALPIGKPADEETALTPDGGDEWRRVDVTYPSGSGYGSNPVSLAISRLIRIVPFAFLAWILIYAAPSMLAQVHGPGSGHAAAVVARGVLPFVGVVALLLAGQALVSAFVAAADLAGTDAVEGVVVRKHYVPSDGEGSSADYWIAVDDRTGPTVAAWRVRSGIYQRVNEADTVRASVTRRYRHVHRVQVLARRESQGG